jgi:hypothetical protein
MQRAVALALLLAACGPPSEEEYAERYIRLGCEYISECFADLDLFEDVNECVQAATDNPVLPDPGCVYQGEAAQDCLQAMEDLDCPEEGGFPEMPASCDEVYTDCPPEDDGPECCWAPRPGSDTSPR